MTKETRYYRGRSGIIGVIDDPKAIKAVGGFKALNEMGIFKSDGVRDATTPHMVKYRGRYNITALAKTLALLDRIDGKSNDINCNGNVRIGFAKYRGKNKENQDLSVIELRHYPSGLRIILAPRYEEVETK